MARSDNALTMTEEAESYDGPWEWSLGSFAQTEQGPQITIGRVISDDKHAEWKAAASFIRTSLRQKLEAVLDRERIPRTDAEIDTLFGLRASRNDAVHGRAREVPGLVLTLERHAAPR